jgi:uncharacterized membrane protein YbhN (UPF0104 family)
MIGRISSLMPLLLQKGRSIRHTKWAKQLGYLVTLAMLGLMVWVVLSDYQMVKEALSRVRPGWVMIAIGLNFLGHGLLALNWHQMLKRCGYSLPVYRLFRIYFLSGVTRYLPGGFWHFGGRIVWLNHLSVPLKASTQTVVAEQVSVLWVALVSSMFFVFVQSLQGLLRQTLLGLMCFLLLIAASVILTWTLKAADHEVHNYKVQSFKQIALYFVFWLCYGISIYILIVALQYPIQQIEPFKVIGYASLSWAVGYLVIFVPGGVGVREGILTVLLSALLPFPIAGTIALLARMVSTIPELIWAASLAKLPLIPT